MHVYGDPTAHRCHPLPRRADHISTPVERTARADADAALNRAADSFADLCVLRAATFSDDADRAARESAALDGIITDLHIARGRLNAIAGAR